MIKMSIEPQLIVAHQGQYLPSKVRVDKIIQFGTDAISPREVLPFGLQEPLEVMVRAREAEGAVDRLVRDASARASRLDAEFFIVDQIHQRPANGEPGYVVFSAQTQAYMRNPNARSPKPTD